MVASGLISASGAVLVVLIAGVGFCAGCDHEEARTGLTGVEAMTEFQKEVDNAQQANKKEEEPEEEPHENLLVFAIEEPEEEPHENLLVIAMVGVVVCAATAFLAISSTARAGSLGRTNRATAADAKAAAGNGRIPKFDEETLQIEEKTNDLSDSLPASEADDTCYRKCLMANVVKGDDQLQANLEKVDESLCKWGECLKKQFGKPSWKDAVYSSAGYEQHEIPLSMIDAQMVKAIAHRTDVWRVPAFPVPYWYLSTPPKDTPFNGPHAEEIMIPIPQTSERLVPIALVKYVLTSPEEREAKDSPLLAEHRKDNVDDYFQDGRYKKESIDDKEIYNMLKSRVEEKTGPAGLYFRGVDREHKKTGHGLDPQCSPFADFSTWQPVMLEAWKLRDTEQNSVYAGNFSEFKIGAMFDNTFDSFTGRASANSKVLGAHGTHPIYVQQILKHGFSDKHPFKQDARVPTFPSAKQFITLGKGFYITTQWGKADQYVQPMDEKWVSGAGFDFDAYNLAHAEAVKENYWLSNFRKAPRYMLIMEAKVHNAFVLPAGVADLQQANVPLPDWANYWMQNQQELLNIRDGARQQQTAGAV